MASVLEPVVFDHAAFRRELSEFDALLRDKHVLKEREDIIPFFKARKHLTAFIAALYLNVVAATEVCFEFDISGNFAADVLLGSRAAKQFCVVEFESGEDAIFRKQSHRKNPEWGARFEHAFSQIVDWFWALEDQRGTADFRTTFGDGEITFASLLIMGRQADLDDAKKRRLAWRTKKVLIDSNKVVCITFDELYSSLKEKYDFLADAAEAEKAAPAPGLAPPPDGG